MEKTNLSSNANYEDMTKENSNESHRRGLGVSKDNTNESESSPMSKRIKTSPTMNHNHVDLNATNSATDTNDGNTFLDIPTSLKLTPGTRIQVLWDIYKSENDKIPTEHWWGATLLPYDDGRTFLLSEEDDEEEQVDPGSGEESVREHKEYEKNSINKTTDYVVLPLRRLDYDAFPEGGFPERSIEDVCFMTDQALFIISTNDTTSWRLEGVQKSSDADTATSHPIVSMGDMANATVNEGYDETQEEEISISSSSPQEGLRSMIDTILQSAMVKSGVMEKMAKLSASQQLIMAERIAASKEKLIAKMEQQVQQADTQRKGKYNTLGGIRSSNSDCGIMITAEHVRKCMEELKQELSM